MDEFYKNSDDHLYDELLLIDLLIHAQVIKFRADKTTPKNNLQGLYISEEEIDHLLKQKTININWVDLTQDVDDNFDKITNAIKKLSESIKIKITNTLNNNINLKLIELARLYDLNSFETNVLTICLAPQFDSKYRMLFAYLQNDVTRKNPSVELILNLICTTFKEKLTARQFFNFQSPLFKNNILQFIENPREPDKPLITRELKINTRIVGFILGQGLIDDDIYLISEFYSSKMFLKEIVVPNDIREKLGNFVSYFKANELMVIMATNFITNMDPAFERRLHFSVSFPLPDEYSRLLIWQNIFPDKTSLAEDIDYEYLAKTFTISGGNIKNIALSSAFSTAESKDETMIITMKKILEACKLEYEKIGRLWDNQYIESIKEIR